MNNLSEKSKKTGCPEDILSYLPLIANGTCPPEIQEKLKDIIDANPDCARELEEFRTLSSAIEEDAEQIPVPSEAILDNVLHRIETQELREISPAKVTWFSRLSQNIAEWFTVPRLQGAMAVAIVLILVQTGIIIHQSRKTAPYHTLAGTTELTPSRIALKIIFTPEVNLGEITAFLQATKGQIIAGPGPGGVFTISIPKPDDPETFIKDLKSHKNLIRFAEIRN